MIHGLHLSPFAAFGRFLRRFRRREEGVVAVEMALSLPIYISVFFGVIELARVLFTLAFLYYAAQEGTRFAIVRDGLVTTQQIESFAADKLAVVVDGETAVVTSTAPVDPQTGTRLITVSVRMAYRPWMPLLPDFDLGAESSGFLAFQL